LNGIGEAALEVQQIVEQLGFEFCIIGGLAVVYWGHPRATQDIDVSLQVPLGREKQVSTTLLARLDPRIEDAVSFAEESRMLLVSASNGTPVDIALAAFPMEHAIIARSGMRELQPGLILRLISAEDLVITKAIAARPRDLADIQGIIDRQGVDLDRKQILTHLTAFCDVLETDEPLSILQQMFS
jgi:predicted nucleotidyltransferase